MEIKPEDVVTSIGKLPEIEAMRCVIDAYVNYIAKTEKVLLLLINKLLYGTGHLIPDTYSLLDSLFRLDVDNMIVSYLMNMFKTRERVIEMLRLEDALKEDDPQLREHIRNIMDYLKRDEHFNELLVGVEEAVGLPEMRVPTARFFGLGQIKGYNGGVKAPAQEPAQAEFPVLPSNRFEAVQRVEPLPEPVITNERIQDRVAEILLEIRKADVEAIVEDPHAKDILAGTSMRLVPEIPKAGETEKKLLVWVDDMPENNFEIIAAVRRRDDILPVFLNSSQSFKDFLLRNLDSIKTYMGCPERLRFITDRVRVEPTENDDPVYYMGHRVVIFKIRAQLHLASPILIYCGAEDHGILDFHKPEEGTTVTSDIDVAKAFALFQ